MNVTNQNIDGNGVISWDCASDYNGGATNATLLRVMAPTAPTPGRPHRFIWVLPVAGSTSIFSGTEAPLSEGGRWDQPASSPNPMQKSNGALPVGADSFARFVPSVPADQYSEITYESDVPANTWLGVTTRIATGGAGYLAIAFAGEIRLYRVDTSPSFAYTLLASASASLGTAPRRLRLVSAGSLHTVYFNDSSVTSATDGTHTTGQPGIAASSFGGSPIKIVTFRTRSYNVDFGDGLEEMRTQGYHDTYNATLIAPSFVVEPWIGDHASDATTRYESFLTRDAVPWATQNLRRSGTEEHWLVSFSKGAYGGLDLIFRNPTVFHRCAAWDPPADVTTAAHWTDWEMVDAYGTQANFDDNYKLTQAFLSARAGTFQVTKRLWFNTDDSAFEAEVANLLTRLGIAGVQYSLGGSTTRAHHWTSGWLPDAMAALQAQFEAGSRPVTTAPISLVREPSYAGGR